MPGQSWDHKLAALMSQGCVSGFALLSHRGECIAACGVLEAEFATAADLPSPAAHQVMALFDPLREPEAQSVVLTLCGTRQQVSGLTLLCIHKLTMPQRNLGHSPRGPCVQVFKRDAGAVWATAARQRSGS